MLFFIIVLCAVSYTSPSSASRYDPRKESLSRQRKTNQDVSLVFGARNQTLVTESSHLSPLVHHAYLQIQAAVQTSYTIQVGNIKDGNADSNACSATALRSTCNLRSAWALCMSLIQAVTCPSSASQAVSVTCAIILPSSTSIAFNSGHGGAMSLSTLSSWASTCKNTLVTLSIASLSTAAKTYITGDGTSTSLLYLRGNPFVRFSMRNVAVMGFGDGSAAFTGAVCLSSLLGATFGPNVQFGPSNVGYNSSGALVVRSLSSVTVLNSVFVGNSAVVQTDYNNLYAQGGALSIFSSNNIFILNSTFVNNSLPGGYGDGGALYVLSSNNVTISGCKWLGNSNVVGNGGALFFWLSNKIIVIFCSFLDNINSGDGGWGGALYFQSSNTITVTGCTIEGNSISGGLGKGGALFFAASNSVIMTNCSIVGNSIIGGGGAGGALAFYSSNTITVTGCNFEGNSNTGDDGWGGALFLSYSNQISIAQCSFASNIADDGGAIFIFKTAFIGMSAVQFSRNVALTGAGGAVYVADSCSYISFGGPMPLLETCVGVCDQATNTDASGYGHSNTLVQEPSSLQVVGYYVIFNDLANNLFAFCAEHAIVGDYLFGDDNNCTSANTAPGVNGEAPYFWKGNTLTISYTRYNAPGNNYANIWIFPVSRLISMFDRNSAATYGGAIFIGNSVNNVFVMSGTVFTSNSVTGNGGAVSLASFSNNIYFYATVFQGNNSSTNGGAVAFQKLVTSVHFFDCSFLSNSAQYGGGVYLDTGNGNDLSLTGLIKVIEFVNVTMRHNNADFDGGGIYANNLNVLSLVNSRLMNNVAGRSGGAVATNTINTMSISTSTSFVHNSAGTDGGAIFSNANNTINSVSGTTMLFSQNTCKGRGGALAMNAGSIVTINGTTTFDSNYATRQGGAISISASSLVLGPSPITFINNSAVSGSAMYLTSSSTSSVMLFASYNNVTFRNNVCRKNGGTVFSVKDLQSTTQLFGLQIPYYNQRVVFDNNIAGVGKGIATQTTNLRSTSNHTTVLVTDYNIFLRPSLMFSLVDDFNNVNTTDFSTTFSQPLLLYLPHISFNHLFPSFSPVVNISGHCDGTELLLWYWPKSFRIFEWCNNSGSSCGCSDI